MTVQEEIYNSFVQNFSSVLRKKTNNVEISKFFFLCIGTDRVTGDSFGPLVGYKLKYLLGNKKNIEILGNLNSIICRHNILKILNEIKSKYENPFIVAIDAAISSKKTIGTIVISGNSMKVGSSLNKENIYAGDMSIKGIVSRDLNIPKYNFKLLQNTSLNLIMNMSNLVAKGIYDVIMYNPTKNGKNLYI